MQMKGIMVGFHEGGSIFCGIGERCLEGAVRLFGNMMSGTMIGGILLAVTPLIFPVIMNLFGLLTGLIQACIFTIPATIFIPAAVEV